MTPTGFASELVPRMTSGGYTVANREWIELLRPAAELAKSVAGTDFVPKALRNNPAAIAACILYGDEIGLGPMQSLAKVAVIDGRPAVAAETQRALILQAGHELWLEESSVTAVTIAGRRAGTDVTQRVTWTLDDARRANLAGRPSWRNYPRQMLLARASAELARALFADVIGGLGALEELEDGDGIAELETEHGLELAPRARRRRIKRVPATATDAQAAAVAVPIATVTAPTPPEEADALTPVDGEEGTPRASEAQTRRLFAAFRAAGYTGDGSRARRLTFSESILGRPLASSKDLTADEASRLMEALEAAPSAVGDGPDAGEAAPPASPAPSPAGAATPTSRAPAGASSPAGGAEGTPVTTPPAGDTDLLELLEADRPPTP